MSSLNKVQLIGRLGKDPTIRTTQQGVNIVSFSIATSENWKDKSTGEKKELTNWHNVVCFNENLGDIIERYVFKGSLIYVEGKLVTRKWQDKDGKDRWSTEVVLGNFDGKIVLLSSKSDSAPAEDEDEAPKSKAKGKKRAEPDLDDEIPF